MKRLLMLLMATMFAMVLVACGNDSKERTEIEYEDELANEKEHNEKENADDKLDGFEEQVKHITNKYNDDSEKLEMELYSLTLNHVLNDYDEKYNEFDMEAGIALHDLIVSVSKADINVARKMKDDMLGSLDKEETEVYGSFFDDIIDLIETFEVE